MRSNAIAFANNHTLNEDLSVLSTAKDYPILDDSVGYTPIDNNIVSSFEKGWGRQINGIYTSTGSLYGDTHYEPYKDMMKHLFEIGPKKSLKKMNATTMHNKLKKAVPYHLLYIW